jgi:hypothetical protein
LKERASPLGDVAIKIFYPGTKCTNGTSDLIDELVEFNTDIILCPFLTAKIPAELYKKVSHFTLPSSFTIINLSLSPTTMAPTSNIADSSS